MKKGIVLIFASFISALFLVNFLIPVLSREMEILVLSFPTEKRILYAMILTSTFSLFGFLPYIENIYLFANGYKRLSESEKGRLFSLLADVIEKSNAKHGTDFNLAKMNIRMVKSKEKNAVAIGRKSIAIYKGLLALHDEELKGILAHELGHLYNNDSRFGLGLWFVFLPQMIFMTLYQVLVRVFNCFVPIIKYIPFINIVALGFSLLITMFSIFMTLLNFILFTIYEFLLKWSSRSDEYGADEFAASLGYGAALATSLEKIAGAEKRRFKIIAWIKELWSTHPDVEKRIAILKGYK